MADPTPAAVLRRRLARCSTCGCLVTLARTVACPNGCDAELEDLPDDHPAVMAAGARDKAPTPPDVAALLAEGEAALTAYAGGPHEPTCRCVDCDHWRTITRPTIAGQLGRMVPRLLTALREQVERAEDERGVLCGALDLAATEADDKLRGLDAERLAAIARAEQAERAADVTTESLASTRATLDAQLDRVAELAAALGEARAEIARLRAALSEAADHLATATDACAGSFLVGEEVDEAREFIASLRGRAAGKTKEGSESR